MSHGHRPVWLHRSGRRNPEFGISDDRHIDRQLREGELLHLFEPEDLINFGLIPELVGRIGFYAMFGPLTADDLNTIVVDVEDTVLQQQQMRAELKGFSLEFEDDAIDAICRRAYVSRMGPDGCAPSSASQSLPSSSRCRAGEGGEARRESQ